MSPAFVFATERLRLRRLAADDAPFILRLVNDPSWLRFIGDRGIRTLDDARAYILKGPVASYEQHGFGLWLVELKDGGASAGICGLLKRDTLPDVDVGFAFLPEFCGRGYATEAGLATMAYGRTTLGLRRIVAITAPGNERSVRTLEKLGLRFEQPIKLVADGPELQLFAWGG